MMGTGYACKACGAPAAVDADGTIARSCAHAGTIIAGMKATAYGEGGASAGVRLTAPVMRLLRHLGEALRAELVKRRAGAH